MTQLTAKRICGTRQTSAKITPVDVHRFTAPQAMTKSRWSLDKYAAVHYQRLVAAERQREGDLKNFTVGLLSSTLYGRKVRSAPRDRPSWTMETTWIIWCARILFQTKWGLLYRRKKSENSSGWSEKPRKVESFFLFDTSV